MKTKKVVISTFGPFSMDLLEYESYFQSIGRQIFFYMNEFPGKRAAAYLWEEKPYKKVSYVRKNITKTLIDEYTEQDSFITFKDLGKKMEMSYAETKEIEVSWDFLRDLKRNRESLELVNWVETSKPENVAVVVIPDPLVYTIEYVRSEFSHFIPGEFISEVHRQWNEKGTKLSIERLWHY